MAVGQSVYQIRSEDKTAAFSAVYSNGDIGLDIAFDYMLRNFQFFVSGQVVHIFLIERL